jgi:eukaryotic-like serine/threonine-protein kinase
MSMLLRAPADAHHALGADVVDAAPTEPRGRLVARRYRLRALLGRGGMGRVWLADDTTLHRPVALKQLLPDGVDAAWERALREARAAASVSHAGVVTIYDIVTDDRCPWIVMEPLSGRTLREALDVGPLPVDRVVSIGLRLLEVLAETHRAGIVHLDVKPSNVHLCDDDRVVLTDFGIASTMDNVSPVPGTFSGSPAYIAPERLTGDQVGPAADMFSLGATLFAAVEGVAPFDRDSVHDTFMAITDGTPPPFRRAGQLRPIIEGLLATDPHRRLSVDETRTALHRMSR